MNDEALLIDGARGRTTAIAHSVSQEPRQRYPDCLLHKGKRGCHPECTVSDCAVAPDSGGRVR